MRDHIPLAISGTVADPSVVKKGELLTTSQLRERICDSVGSFPTELPLDRKDYHYLHEHNGKTEWRLASFVQPVPKQQPPDLVEMILDAYSGEILAEMPCFVAVEATDARCDQPTTNQLNEVCQKGNCWTQGLPQRFTPRNEHQPGLETQDRPITYLDAQPACLLCNPLLKVCTHSFAFQHVNNVERLPGQVITKGADGWPADGVALHANASAFAEFVSKYFFPEGGGLDGAGTPFIAVMDCQGHGTQRREWPQAQWFHLKKLALFGQVQHGQELKTLGCDPHIVSHEFAHGLIDSLCQLQRTEEPGALSESYADLLAVVIGNRDTPDPLNWNWTVPADPDLLPKQCRDLRKLRSPLDDASANAYSQYLKLRRGWGPPSGANDWGGVHTSCSIHSKAGYLFLTARDQQDQPLFDLRSAAFVLYDALSHLGQTATFKDSRNSLRGAARSWFRTQTESPGSSRTERRELMLKAIDQAFAAVGVR